MKILVVQNRMGIGDMVIFLPFIEAISKKFKTSVNILVKENSKAFQFLGENKHINEIIILDRENKNKEGKHDGIIGSLRLAHELKKYQFDKVFIFNSSLRFNLISKIARIKHIYQYPLFKKKNQHIIKSANKFLKETIKVDVESKPKILLNKKLIDNSRLEYNIVKDKTNILLGIGGSGSTKRIPSKIFIKFMTLTSAKYNCRFFLATGKNNEEQIILDEIMKTKLNKICTPLDNLNLKEIMPIIANCNISVCNDSSFSHLSSALNIKTIVLMSDTPLMYGSYSTNMYPIIPDGEKTVTHKTLGKDRINPDKIFKKLKNILN